MTSKRREGKQCLESLLPADRESQWPVSGNLWEQGLPRAAPWVTGKSIIFFQPTFSFPCSPFKLNFLVSVVYNCSFKNGKSCLVADCNTVLVIILEMTSALPLALSSSISSLLCFLNFSFAAEVFCYCDQAQNELRQSSNDCWTSSDLFNGSLPSLNHFVLFLIKP